MSELTESELTIIKTLEKGNVPLFKMMSQGCNTNRFFCSGCSEAISHFTIMSMINRGLIHSSKPILVIHDAAEFEFDTYLYITRRELTHEVGDE